MPRLFRRTASLIVYRTTIPAAGEDFFVQKGRGPNGEDSNGIEITDLRMEFSVDRDLSKHPNRCDVKIYNLADKTRAAMQTKPLTVEMYAGYDGHARLMFAGDVIWAGSELSGPTWQTMLQIGDGARATANARVAKSYRGGVTARTVLKDIAKSMGQEISPTVETLEQLDAQYSRGLAILGASRDELAKLLTPLKLEYSFQNNKLQVLPEDTARSDIFVISEETGMIGTPTFGDPPKSGKPPHVKVKMLLYPELTPGGQVKVISRGINGDFRLKKVSHSGDTEGSDWHTNVEIVPLGETLKRTPGR